LFSNQRTAKILVTVIAVCSILWIIDALWQQVTGTDVLGIPLEDRGRWGSRVTGPFNGNNHLGMLLAVTLPVTLKWLSRFHIVLQLLYISMLGLVLLLTGVKTNWITFVLAIICFYWFVRGGRRSLLCILVPLLICSVLAAYSYSPLAKNKLNQLTSVPTTLKGWDEKSTGRIHIWAAAWNMGMENPLTGVGAKSFKYAYLDHRVDWDPSPQKNGITAHSHAEHQWISIFAETGFLGVICLAGTVLLVICLAVRSPYGFNFYHYPWLLTFLLILNPINSIPPLFKMWFFPIFLLAIISQISAVENAEREIDTGIV
jgi:O-antigen ligase